VSRELGDDGVEQDVVRFARHLVDDLALECQAEAACAWRGGECGVVVAAAPADASASTVERQARDDERVDRRELDRRGVEPRFAQAESRRDELAGQGRVKCEWLGFVEDARIRDRGPPRAQQRVELGGIDLAARRRGARSPRSPRRVRPRLASRDATAACAG
jgi:hypothetical protein